MCDMKSWLFQQIHGSWLFLPWHRAYLYFYERILAKLLNDTSFALPFWNWDHPSAMAVPPIFQPPSSPLSNPTRFPAANSFINLGGCDGDNAAQSLPAQRQCNLQLMRRQFTAAFDSPSLFFGGTYRAGDQPFPGVSPIENSPHSIVHSYTSADMADLIIAARDPLFFSHHANLDRLWTVWERMRGNASKLFYDEDFLNASFLFRDENLQLVRVTVRDVVETSKLGYAYEEVALPWMNVTTVVEEKGREKVLAAGEERGEARFPLVLSSQVSVKVARKVGETGEVLVVSDIALDGRDYVWFKVYVGREGGRRVEVGSFVNMQRRGKKRFEMVTKLRIGIGKFVEEMGAGGDERVVVSLVPEVGGEKVSVGGILIVCGD